MSAIDYLLIAGVLFLLGVVVLFVVRSRQKGKKCIGCPHSESCSSGCSSCR